jgi:predicted Zn-dependent protease
MKRAAFAFLPLALGSILLGATHKPIFGSTGPYPIRHISHISISGGGIARAFAAAPRMPDDDISLARQRLAEESAGTYIEEVLAERDSAVIRWADRLGVPLTVWIQPQSDVRDYTSAYVAHVRAAFVEWDSVHLPVGFSFVEDSATADVHVTWIDHFDEQISGRTRWSHDDAFTITDANIVLAVHHTQGDQLEGDAMQAMALHEIGHLLGLDHTTDSLAVMAPRVRVRELSAADRATARLLYALPTGSLR